MKRLSPIKWSSGLLAVVTFVAAAPVFANTSDASPQCGGDKEGKTSKPAPAPAPAPKPPA